MRQASEGFAGSGRGSGARRLGSPRALGGALTPWGDRPHVLPRRYAVRPGAQTLTNFWDALLCSLIVLLASGCGYTLGYRSPPGVETVAVPIFQNATFPLRRDVEYEITSRFREELQARTPLRLVDSKTADLLILGKVREFRDPTVAEGPRDERIESVLIVAVDLVIEDYVNGTQSQVPVEVVEPFSDQLGERASDVRARAFKNLAERMVLAIESWESGQLEKSAEKRQDSQGGER